MYMHKSVDTLYVNVSTQTDIVTVQRCGEIDIRHRKSGYSETFSMRNLYVYTTKAISQMLYSMCCHIAPLFIQLY